MFKVSYDGPVDFRGWSLVLVVLARLQVVLESVRSATLKLGNTNEAHVRFPICSWTNNGSKKRTSIDCKRSLSLHGNKEGCQNRLGHKFCVGHRTNNGRALHRLCLGHSISFCSCPEKSLRCGCINTVTLTLSMGFVFLRTERLFGQSFSVFFGRFSISVFPDVW